VGGSGIGGVGQKTVREQDKEMNSTTGEINTIDDVSTIMKGDEV
jgi:hypothetical protein